MNFQKKLKFENKNLTQNKTKSYRLISKSFKSKVTWMVPFGVQNSFRSNKFVEVAKKSF